MFAKISQTDVFSSHPDHDEVFKYISKTINPNSNETVFLIHGEETQLSAMKNALQEVGINKVEIPDMIQEYIL